jgi:hypothetical protein
MMNKQSSREINSRLVALRKSQQVPTDRREAPTLQYLREQLAAEVPQSLRRDLLALLAVECARLDLPGEEEEALRQAVELDPAEPMPHIALATFLQQQADRLDEARDQAKLAIEYSETTGRFRRHALQAFARIAKDRRDYAELAAAFESLVALRVEKGAVDSGVENDFLVGLPDGVVKADLVEKVHARK